MSKKINPTETTNPRKRKLKEGEFSKRKIQRLRLACGMAGMPMNDAAAETILMVMDGVKRYGGDFDLYTASRIQAYINGKYSKPSTEKKK